MARKKKGGKKAAAGADVPAGPAGPPIAPPEGIEAGFVQELSVDEALAKIAGAQSSPEEAAGDPAGIIPRDDLPLTPPSFDPAGDEVQTAAGAFDLNINDVPFEASLGVEEDLSDLPIALQEAMDAFGLTRAQVLGHRLLDDGGVSLVTAGGRKLTWPADQGRVLSAAEKGDPGAANAPRFWPAGFLEKGPPRKG